MEEVAEINRFATEGLKPDLTLYLDIEAEVGLNRIADKRSNREHDRLEREAVKFHENVRQGYLQLLEKHADRFVCVDASQEEEAVAEECFRIVEKRLIEKGYM